MKNFAEKFGGKEKMSTFAIPNENNAFETQNSGAIAQLVEQRTENPCVPGSIPGGTTKNLSRSNSIEVFFIHIASLKQVLGRGVNVLYPSS